MFGMRSLKCGMQTCSQLKIEEECLHKDLSRQIVPLRQPIHEHVAGRVLIDGDI